MAQGVHELELVNSLTAYPIGSQIENINGIPMRGIFEKQGVAFSRLGYLAAQENPTIDPDLYGSMIRKSLRPLSLPTLNKARKEYADRTVIPFPRYFIIEPIALCNRACPFCSILVTNRKGMMKWGDFTKLMDECKEHDVYGISLYQLGESFLWRGEFKIIDTEGIYPISVVNITSQKRNISHMVDYAKSSGFRAVNISTNGDVDNLDLALDCDLDDLIISIDGTTADVYNVNRPSTRKNDTGAFERTMQRVHTFLEHKASRGQSKPFVRLQCINMENTANQILDFVRYWIDVPGVDDVLVKHLDGMQSWLGDSVVSKEESEIKRKRVAAMPCQHLWAIGSMTADGSLTGCCHDAKTELTTAGCNINSMSFADWWNGEFMTTLRNEHNTGTFRQPCVSCLERDPWLG